MPERQVKHQKFKYTPGIASSALSRPPLVSSQGTPTLSPPTPLELHEYAPSLLPYLYCGTPCGGGPYPGAPPGPPLGGPPYWFIITPNFLVGLQTKRYNGDEAKGKPFPSLHYAARHVAAI